MDIISSYPDAIERAEVLDAPAYRLTNAVSTTLQLGGRPALPLQDALHGVWLGHPLHPALATLPIGCGTLAFGLGLAGTLGAVPARAARGADIVCGGMRERDQGRGLRPAGTRYSERSDGPRLSSSVPARGSFGQPLSGHLRWLVLERLRAARTFLFVQLPLGALRVVAAFLTPLAFPVLDRP